MQSNDEFHVNAEVNMWAEVCQSSLLQLLSLAVESQEEPEARNSIISEYYNSLPLLMEQFSTMVLQMQRIVSLNIGHTDEVATPSLLLEAATSSQLGYLDEKKSALEASVRHCEELLKGFERQLSEKEQLILSKNEEMSLVETQINDMSRQKVSLEKDIDHLEARFRSINEVLPEREVHLTELDSAISSKEKHLLSINIQVEEKSSALTSLTERLAMERLKEQADVQQVFTYSEHRLEQLEESIRLKEEELLRVSLELGEKKIVVESMEEKLATLESQLHAKHELVSQQEKIVANQESSAAQKAADLTALSAQLSAKVSEVHQIQLELDRKASERSQQEGVLMALSVEVQSKSNALLLCKEQAAKEEEKQQKWIVERQQLEEEKRALLSDSAAANGRKERVLLECQQLESEKGRLLSHIAHVQEDLKKYESRCAEFEQSITEKEKMMYSLNDGSVKVSGLHSEDVPHPSHRHDHDSACGLVSCASSTTPLRRGGPRAKGTAAHRESPAPDTPPVAFPKEEYVVDTAVPENHLLIAASQPVYHRILLETPVNPVTASLIAVQEHVQQLRGSTTAGGVQTPRAGRPAGMVPSPSIARELYRQYVPRGATSVSPSPGEDSRPRSTSRSRYLLDTVIPLKSSFGSGSAAEKLKHELRQIRRLATKQQVVLATQQAAAV